MFNKGELKVIRELQDEEDIPEYDVSYQGEHAKKKMSQIVEKVHNFHGPPPPQDNVDYFEFGKKMIFDDPPPSDLIWEKIEIGKVTVLGTPPPPRKKCRLI